MASYTLLLLTISFLQHQYFAKNPAPCPDGTWSVSGNDGGVRGSCHKCLADYIGSGKVFPDEKTAC